MARKYGKFIQDLKDRVQDLEDENAYLKETIYELETQVEIIKDSEEYYKKMYYSMVQNSCGSSGRHFHIKEDKPDGLKFNGKVSVSVQPHDGFEIRFHRS